MDLLNIEAVGTVRQGIQVTTEDHDELTEIVSWCGGEAIDEGEAVIRLREFDDEYATVLNGDWILTNPHGGFHVVKQETFNEKFKVVGSANDEIDLLNRDN